MTRPTANSVPERGCPSRSRPHWQPALPYAGSRFLPARNTQHALVAPKSDEGGTRNTVSPAFTLIELIAVMAILTVAITLAAPKMSGFFHGRSVDLEARRLLAMAHAGQNRAISEGVPVDLWVDVQHGAYGLTAEPSYEPEDPRSETNWLGEKLSIRVANLNDQAALMNNAPSPMDSPTRRRS